MEEEQEQHQTQPQSQAPYHHPRRQQRKACDICRRRKVRCDIVLRPGPSCSVCDKSGIECRFTAKWAPPARGSLQARRARQEARADAEAPEESGEPEPTDEIEDGISSLAGAAASSPQPIILKPSINDQPLSSGQEHPARNGLARFFKDGISAGAWAVFDSMDSFRIAYVGTAVSNLVHLVDLHRSFRQPYAIFGEGHRPLSSDTAPDPALEGSAINGSAVSEHGVVGKVLHYPYPPIRPGKPWKPSPDNWGITSMQDLASEVSSFPAPEVRDALVTAYFQHIHPFLPIISMPEFFASYRSPDRPPPLLLFQAVLMAGAHVCSHPLVVNDRHAVKSVLFRRASMLFHIRHETDRIHLMQAAALFTWHVGDGDTVAGGPWYWAGTAVRIGCGLGAHRRSSVLPAKETSQYRRCWWAVFVLEVFSSLETGRPCAIRAEDIDQLPLSGDNITDGPSPRTDISDMDAHSIHLNRLVELAYIVLDVVAMSAPSQERLIDINAINSRLGLWSLRSGISSAADSSDPSIYHLRMHYNLVLLHLHRSTPDESSSKSICSTAAQAIVSSLEQLAALDALRQCHFTGVSAITAAGIQFASEIRAAVLARTFLVAIHALERLGRLLQSATLLAAYWPNAQAVHSVFEEVHLEYETIITQDLQGEQVIIPEIPPDWNRLLGGEHPHQLNGLSADQGWLNIPNWTGLL
ncbi:hypothetical protein G7046_g7083 [Stylonectria norvegica]|nr:hypothetical protein G7046_g7083 [Stylonectria norvegica]